MSDFWLGASLGGFIVSKFKLLKIYLDPFAYFPHFLERRLTSLVLSGIFYDCSRGRLRDAVVSTNHHLF